jgi:hypothetical protein
MGIPTLTSPNPCDIQKTINMILKITQKKNFGIQMNISTELIFILLLFF